LQCVDIAVLLDWFILSFNRIQLMKKGIEKCQSEFNGIIIELAELVASERKSFLPMQT